MLLFFVGKVVFVVLVELRRVSWENGILEVGFWDKLDGVRLKLKLGEMFIVFKLGVLFVLLLVDLGVRVVEVNVDVMNWDSGEGVKVVGLEVELEGDGWVSWGIGKGDDIVCRIMVLKKFGKCE